MSPKNILCSLANVAVYNCQELSQWNFLLLLCRSLPQERLLRAFSEGDVTHTQDSTKLAWLSLMRLLFSDNGAH